MKKHNTVKVVLLVILLFLVLSWILPAAYYSSSYQEQGRVQMGLFDLVNYPFTSLSYFGYIALFLILVGGFYGVLNKIPAYHNYLERLAKSCKSHPKVTLTIISVILAFGVSICGLQIGFAIFIPLIVSIILLMGYDKMVAAMIIVGSMIAGFAGSTYATSNLSVLTQALKLGAGYAIGVRFLILIVGIFLVVFNTIMYIARNKAKFVSASKSEVKKSSVVSDTKKAAPKKSSTTRKSSTTTKKKSTSKSTTKKTTTRKSSTKKNPNKAAVTDNDVITVSGSKSKKVWPFNLFFIIMFVIMILAFIPWNAAFKIDAMEKAKTAISDFKIFKFALFAKILGNFNEFGSWTVVDLLLPLLVVMFILAYIYKLSFDDVLDGIAEGAKKALKPAVIVVLLYTVLVLVTYHPFQLVIYKALLGSKFNIITTSVVAILSSFFNFEPAYVFQSVLPFYTSVITNSANYSLVGIIFQSMYGLTMLVAPTSLILMCVLSYLDINYKDWLKNIWKLLLEFFVILLIIFIIMAL